MASGTLRPAGYRFRTTFHRRWTGYLTIVLLVGLIGGLAMASVAAGCARRRRSPPTWPAPIPPVSALHRIRQSRARRSPRLRPRCHQPDRPPAPREAGRHHRRFQREHAVRQRSAIPHSAGADSRPPLRAVPTSRGTTLERPSCSRTPGRSEPGRRGGHQRTR